jgi:hypothetical protein
MQGHKNYSEVARILAQIEAEYRSAQSGLTGLAETAKHAFITARMEQIHHLQSHLQTMVGEDAIRLVVEQLETLPE